MPLVRSESQGGNILDHYCDNESDSEQIRKWYAAMRDLIPKLDAELPNTDVWVLTSHDSLCLMSVSEYEAGDHHVIIEHYYDGCFRMSYHPPEGELPVSGSHVTFMAIGVPEALARIKIAMAASKGWPDSPDL